MKRVPTHLILMPKPGPEYQRLHYFVWQLADRVGNKAGADGPRRQGHRHRP